MMGVTDPDALRDRRLFRFGGFVHDRRGIVIVLSILLGVGLTSFAAIGPDWAESWGEENVESVAAIEIVQRISGGDDANPEAVILYYSSDWSFFDANTSAAFRQAVNDSLAQVQPTVESRIVNITTPWDVNDSLTLVNMVSDDGHHVKVTIEFKGDRKEAKATYGDVRSTITSDVLTIWRFGGIGVDWSFDHRLEEDLVKAELISAPLTLIILLVVFGTIVSALLPIGIGAISVGAAVGSIILFSNLSDVNQYALNICSLIGIGVSIDYSLFIVNRFREEMRLGRDTRTAIAMTMATAGKAVLFSGLTVAIGLMGMLFFKDTSLPSFGIGGTIAVSLAVLFSLTLLPAILSYLGARVDAGKVPFVPTATDKDDGFWGTIARAVMAHPLVVLIPILILLIGAGLPFLQVSFGMVTYESLPPDDEARQGIERENEVWLNSSSDNSLVIVVEFDEETEWRDPAALEVLYNLSKVVNETDGVKQTRSVAWISSEMDADAVKMLWGTPIEMLPPEMATIRALVEVSSEKAANDSTAIIFIDLEGRANTDASKEIVNRLRDIRVQFEDEPFVDRILVGGFAAYNVDTLELVSDHLLEAMLFIFVATFILVFIQVQSVVIPLKAILMNFLSITASFGMLVYVFQQGHGTDFLNVTPAPIDPINPVLMFCIVFGLSMDYEVLMLSRIHEEWERTGDNVQAVAMGLQRTGRLITGAAAVMVVVFLAFGTSSMTMVKQIGLGLALAIAIDATLVRALVVPATMRLMGRANWWSPKAPWSQPEQADEASE